MSASREIEAYELGYHPTLGCLISLKVKGETTWRKIKCSATDLAAVAAILRQSPVYLTNGGIHTGAEPVV